MSTILRKKTIHFFPHYPAPSYTSPPVINHTAPPWYLTFPLPEKRRRDSSIFATHDYNDVILIHSFRFFARVVELVDTGDLKSLGLKKPYRFDSGPGHSK